MYYKLHIEFPDVTPSTPTSTPKINIIPCESFDFFSFFF